MLGQPASSQTVCRPSRRTSDLSSVYSGPVLSRVLIHSGFRSIGVWLLRTSRRSSLRPAGSIGDVVPPGAAAVSSIAELMVSTVLPQVERPPAREEGPALVRRALLVGCAAGSAAGVARVAGRAAAIRAVRAGGGDGGVRVVVRAAGRLGGGQVALV